MKRLENWYVTGSALTISLKGMCYEDGEIVKTGPVVIMDGRKIITDTKDEYTLGKIEPEYKAYLLSSFEEKFDEDNPLLFLGGFFAWREIDSKKGEKSNG
jgi:hypothetical protein